MNEATEGRLRRSYVPQVTEPRPLATGARNDDPRNRLPAQPRLTGGGERGQVLALFGLGLVALLGCVAMSIDVGRLVAARTQIQAAVDAAALAGAQSLPDQAMGQASAEEHWLLNSRSIRSDGQNVLFETAFPGNKRLVARAEADIPTWFARFVGIDHWHVTAEAEAAAQVLDISVVLDISGSMCWDTYPSVESSAGIYLGPGRAASVVRTLDAIPAMGGATATFRVNDVSKFISTSPSFNSSTFGWSTSTPYYQYTPSPGRRGLIQIGPELLVVTAVDPVTRTVTATRGQTDNFARVTTPKSQHPVDSMVYFQHRDCAHATLSAVGPYQPYDSMISDAQYFSTLFDPRYDKIAVASYSTRAALASSLSANLAAVGATIGGLPKPDGSTNIGHALAVGRQALNGSGKRPNAVRVMVLLTDGRANTYCGSTYNPANYDSTTCPGLGSGADGNPAAVTAALQEAVRAAGEQIIIYTIGLGGSVDDGFLRQVADGADPAGPCAKGQPACRYFKVPTVAQLDDAFRVIAAQSHIGLSR